ncbi:MAG: DUF3365 domain-containing protein, partial [Anaerolineae bacterium]|nr:DUF3365 domain-containing protein [Anaerolineae bacterium]
MAYLARINLKGFSGKLIFSLVGTIVVWGALIAGSLWWNLRQVELHFEATAKNQGQVMFEHIELSRFWNATHGGVYVPITPDTQPNPYLEDPNRDITTTDGLQLTKINPAFMTRQIAEIAQKEQSIQFHITSLMPIRPANAADPWETTALQAFEQGESERFERIAGETGEQYRYMAPLLVKEGCMACHEKQGYQVGDIRGGISVSMPAAPFAAQATGQKNNLIFFHTIIFLLGAVGLTIYQVRSYRVQQDVSSFVRAIKGVSQG